jgi:SAM-dependent methyltransferase
VARTRTLMFGPLARYYDLQYAGKEYRSETRRLLRLARQYGRSSGRRWADIACGTGRHLEYLRGSYSVVGVDRSADMLRIARRRLPGVPLHRAPMQSFRLEGRFDVVSCLFSAIGHLPSERDLERTFANFARHLVPGGVMIVEPWIDPAAFRPGHVHLVQFPGPPAVVRFSVSSRKGNRSRIHYHFLIAERGRGIRHYQETDVGLLVSRRGLTRAVRRAGLVPHFLKDGFTPGRGLVIGVKPVSAD